MHQHGGWFILFWRAFKLRIYNSSKHMMCNFIYAVGYEKIIAQLMTPILTLYIFIAVQSKIRLPTFVLITYKDYSKFYNIEKSRKYNVVIFYLSFASFLPPKKIFLVKSIHCKNSHFSNQLFQSNFIVFINYFQAKMRCTNLTTPLWMHE